MDDPLMAVEASNQRVDERRVSALVQEPYRVGDEVGGLE
jgi:hypothetical protein